MNPSAEKNPPAPRASRIAPASAALLFGLWVLLSGKLEAFHLGVGVLTVMFVVWQMGVLPPMDAGDNHRLRYHRFVPYAFWLLWEMLLSALYVARVVISPRRHLDPQMVEFHSDQPSLLSAVILANSITLTPGTLTIDLTDNRFVVHALTTKTARGLLEGDMPQRVARLFSDTPPPPVKVINPPKEGVDG